MKYVDNQRLEYLDAVKGIGILCITLLHFEDGVFPIWLNTWISLFMITTFYFTSGWTSYIRNRNITPNGLLKKRLKQLGIPYLWFTLLILIFETTLVILGVLDLKIVFRDCYKFIVLHGIGTLWFLPVLMFAEWLFCIIRNSRYPLLFAILFLGLSFLADYSYHSLWYPLRNLNDLHKIIDAPICPIVWTLKAWPIIAIGFFAGKYLTNYIQKTNKALLFILGCILIAFSILLVITPPFDIPYVNGLLSNTIPALGFIFLFASVRVNPIIKFFSYWGINSLVLMCTHYSITEELLRLFDCLILHNSVFSGPRTLVYFTIAILMTYPIVGLFNGKLKYMLGR